MNKFDAVFNSIKKVIKEDINNDKNSDFFFIDLDLELINKEYSDRPVTYTFLDNISYMFKYDEIKVLDLAYNGLNPYKYEFPHPRDLEKSIRIKSPNKQKLIAFLGMFIKKEKLDYICTFIRNSNESEELNKNVK